MTELTDPAGGHWASACGGTEKPTTTRTGCTLPCLWNTTNGEHACGDRDRVVLLTHQGDDQAFALG